MAGYHTQSLGENPDKLREGIKGGQAALTVKDADETMIFGAQQASEQASEAMEMEVRVES